MEEIKQILGEELFKSVSDKLGDKKLLIDDGKMIPKSRFDEVNEKKKQLEADLEEQGKKYETDLAELSKLSGDKEATEKKIADLEASNKKLTEEREADKANYEKQTLINEVLTSNQVLDPEAREIISAKFNDIQVKDGKLIGADDILNPLKESNVYKHMFGKDEFVGQEHNAGDNNKNNNTFLTYEEYEKMPRSQRQSEEVQKRVKESESKW